MEPPSVPAPGQPDRAAANPVTPPRQRWRLVLARAAEAPRLAGRELVDAWETALEASGLPLHRPPGRSRSRVAFAAPLPLGIAAERELAEIFLAASEPAWRVREALERTVPPGWRLVDVFDVWIGAPALAGRVVGADYRVTLAADVDAGPIASAIRALLEAPALPRRRLKGEGSVSYDLRPLLDDVAVEGSTPPVLLVRTRIHPELGTGRPEEVIAALGEAMGRRLDVAEIVRERLRLADES